MPTQDLPHPVGAATSLAESSSTPEISVVVPLYNEESCIETLLAELRAALDPTGRTYEIVAVDDGSADATPHLLANEARYDPRLRVLGWRRNRGQAAALLHGLHAARGREIVTLDGDGQNDPADIPRLLALLDRADMAVGIRAARRDSWLRRAMSRLANALRGRLLGDRMSDSGCALKAFHREVVPAFLPIRTLYSFMPAFAVGAGFRVVEEAVHHRERQGGSSSYGLRQFLWRPLVDMIGAWWFLRRRIEPHSSSSSSPEIHARPGA